MGERPLRQDDLDGLAEADLARGVARLQMQTDRAAGERVLGKILQALARYGSGSGRRQRQLQPRRVVAVGLGTVVRRLDDGGDRGDAVVVPSLVGEGQQAIARRGGDPDERGGRRTVGNDLDRPRRELAPAGTHADAIALVDRRFGAPCLLAVAVAGERREPGVGGADGQDRDAADPLGANQRRTAARNPDGGIRRPSRRAGRRS